MDKSIHSENYRLVISSLKKERVNAGLTQIELAENLAVTQTFVSKCERGERRLDLLEARAFCNAIGISFPGFIERLEAKLEKKK